MALPANWSTVTVTGRFVSVAGYPMAGRVTFSSTVRVVDGGESVIVPASSKDVTLDSDGAFSVDLPATDDPDISPNFYYEVYEQLTNTAPANAADKERRAKYLIQLPAAAPAVDLSDLSPVSDVAELTPYARLATANVFTTSQTLRSSFAGGEDDGTGTDSTSRLNLESYQRANVGSFGETIRHFLRKAKAKAMQAWYFPSGGYNGSGDPVGTFKPVVWAGAHWRSNDGLSLHKHWSVETPDPTGAIQTRFEVRFGDVTRDDAIAGLAKTLVMTNLADLVVRCTNGQVLRLSAPAGTEKGIEFSHDAEGATQFRRWKLRQTSDAESTGNVGSNFAMSRYDDTGSFIDSPIFISRSNGRVGFGVTDPAVRVDVGDDRIRLRTARTPASATAFGNQGDICWDANFVYVCVAPSTWKRAALSTW